MYSKNSLLPTGLAQLIESQPRLAAAAFTLLECVQVIFGDNKLPFFPEYTDHGTNHVIQVLESAIKLIPKTAHSVLEPADWATLVSATLIHDCGMHIRPAGFQSLIRGQTLHKPIPWFKSNQPELDWADEWHEYLLEIRRWDDQQIARVLGMKKPPKEPSSDWKTWNHQDFLLVGEFLRRHHARLAHEIVHYGFPGLTASEFPPLIDSFGPIADLIGVIARSHGYPLRLSLRYLQEVHGSERRPHGILAPYHMALLRISDYLQIQAHRAPAILLHLRDLQSPVSISEWNKHSAISYLGDDDDDFRAIYVHLNSAHSLSTHIQVRSLLEGLQMELDLSSAVLREVYGWSRDETSRLELTKSRVRSNVKSPELLKSLPYYPEWTQFQVAGFEILRLLVEPLYGSRPEIAIRELLQNAVDAVKERRWIEPVSAHSRTELQRADDPEVLLSLCQMDNSDYVIEIRDAGIGMTASTIQNYFLTVGASLRANEHWRSRFVSVRGQVNITRTGRFGIGVLAAFLLGDEIEVLTRYHTESRGVHFRATLGTSPIVLRWADDCPIGTRVLIRLRDEVAHWLLQDANFRDASSWYACRDVHVVRQYNGAELSQEHTVPAYGEIDSPTWRRIQTDEFPELQYAYTNAPGLTCNGIIVVRDKLDLDAAIKTQLSSSPSFSFPMPCIALSDPDARLPMNLTRDKVDWSRTRMFRDVWRSLYRNVYSYALQHGPSTHEHRTRIGRFPLWFKYAPIRAGVLNLGLEMKTGYGLWDPSLAVTLGVRKVLFIPHLSSHRTLSINPQDLPDDTAILTGPRANDLGGDYDSGYAKEFLYVADYILRRPDEWLSTLRPLGRYIILRETDAGDVLRSNLSYRGEITKLLPHGWIMIRTGQVFQPSVNWEEILQDFQWFPTSDLPCIWGEWLLDAPSAKIPESRFATGWRHYFGKRLLPYDPAKRESVHSTAYIKLRNYIDAWKSGSQSWEGFRNYDG